MSGETRLWTGLEISVKLGISESTVWRVLNNRQLMRKMGLVEEGRVDNGDGSCSAGCFNPGKWDGCGGEGE